MFASERLGEVERLGNESVHTAFVRVILPIWPRGSYYQIGDGADVRGFELRPHRVSIALGLARSWLWMLATILASGTLFAAPWRGLWPVTSGVIALAAVATWVLGRLSPDEVARRAILQRTIGHGAPPELLPDAAVARVRDALDAAWARYHELPWREAIARGVASDWLVALAEYHREPRLAATARASLERADLVN